MQCHLVHLSGPKAGQAKSFDAARITLGRASTCDFQFDPYQDLEVASHHAEILLDESTFYIHDLETRGGTYVNGERINRRQRLQSEDFIQFGKHGPELIFRRGLAGPDPQPLPPKAPQTGELEFISGTDAGKIFPVRGDLTTRIGRRGDLEVNLDPRGDMVVSGNHCSIDFHEDRFVVTDTSRNGTYINGDPVEEHAIIRDGDILTLGLGGPRARFRIHPQRRVYPNLEGEFPRLSKDLPASQLAAKLAETYETPKVEQPEASQAPAEGTESSTGEKRRSRFGSRLVLALLALAILFFGALFTILYGQFSPSRPSASLAAMSENYSQEIRNGTLAQNAPGHFSVKVPQGWPTRENGAILNMESIDKALSVEYVRDPRLSEAFVQARLNGSTTSSMPKRIKPANAPYTVYVSKTTDTSRMAVLHTPPNGVPGMALLEASDEIFQQLPDEVLGALTIDNFKMQQLSMPVPSPAPAKTPTPSPAAVGIQPTQVAAAIPTSPGAQASATTASAQAAAASASGGARRTDAPSTAALAQERLILDNKTLGMKLDLPGNWNGESDVDTGILRLVSPSGMDIRIGRDPNPLDPQAVFSAMRSEKWSMMGESDVNQPVAGSARRFSAAIMQKDDQRLMLVLLDQPNKSTLIIYAVHTGGELSPSNTREIEALVRQLAEQSDKGK